MFNVSICSPKSASIFSPYYLSCGVVADNAQITCICAGAYGFDGIYGKYL